jgi:hypothetical protein
MADVRLLEAVVPSEEGFYCVLGLKNGTHHSQTHHKTIQEVEAEADRLVANGADVFFGCGKFITDENRDAANCGLMKSFFLDIDCGEDKAKPDKRGRIRGYIDQATGMQALKELCKTLNLSRPTVVNSGRGWHVYWPLTEAVPKDKWLPVAETFKAKCLELLALAEKRTPGKWHISKLAIPQVDSADGAVAKSVIPLQYTNPTTEQYDERDSNDRRARSR